jgi:beta-lactamase regulating signal transducer with metallopeptidase domain/HEAT repeat protein
MASPLSTLSLPGTLGLLPVLAFLAKATFLLLLSLAGAAALRRTSASARHVVWCGALAALVLLPILSWWAPWRLEVLPSQLASMGSAAMAGTDRSSPTPFITTPAREAASTEQARSTAPANTTPVSTQMAQEPATPAPDPMAGWQPQRASSPSIPARPDQRSSALDARVASSVPPQVPATQDAQSSVATLGTVWLALLALWWLGAVIFLARLVAGAISVRRIVRGAQPLATPAWTRPLWETADRLDLTRVPRLLVSDRVSMPFACGLFNPAIVLPREADAWSDERRRAVFFHELAHVRRRDLIGHTLGRVTCALYWFHPLVWTAARRLRAEAERACDDLVLAAGTRATEYADHLLQILTAVRSASAPTAALAMARRKEFEGRMLAILDPEMPRRAPGRVQSAALVLGFAALTVSVSAMAPAGAPASDKTAMHEGQGYDTSSSLLASGQTGAQDAHILMSLAGPTLAHDGDAAPPREGAVQSGATEEHPRTMPSPVAASADTGDDLGSAVGEMVGTIVGSVVPQVVDATAGAVGSVSNDLANGWYVDADAIANRSMEAVQRAIHGSLGAYGTAWSSDGRVQPDSATTALLVQLLRTDSAASVRKTAAWALAQRDGYGANGRYCGWSSDCRADAKALKAVVASNLCLSFKSSKAAKCRDRERAARNDGNDENAVSDAPLRRENSTITAALAAALAHDQSADVREMAAWGLSRGEGSVAVQALGDAVQRDGSTDVKSTAAWALGQIGDSSAVPALDGALADPSATVSSRAAWALGQIEPARAPAGLARALSDSESHVRLMAAWALGEIADSTTLSALSSALSTEKNEKVRQAELRAVFLLGQDSDAALRELLKSPDPDVRVRATRALAGYGVAAWPMPMPMPMPRPMP